MKNTLLGLQLYEMKFSGILLPYAHKIAENSINPSRKSKKIAIV